MCITREWLAALRPEDRAEYADTELPGLRLRANKTGARSWSVFVTLPDGRRKRLTVGSALTIGPRAAREKARQLAAEARLGKTPKRETGGPTIATLAAAFMASHEWARLARGTRLNWALYVEHQILPALGKRDPATVTRADVRAWAGDIARSTPTTANRAFEVLRRIYNWGLDGELISCANPCARLAKPSPERRRSRVYSDDELRRILGASAGSSIEVLIRLVMLTLLRSGEARAIRYEWFDATRTLLTIPAAAAKSRTPHPVPLTVDAQALLFGLYSGEAPTEPASETAAGPLFPADSRTGSLTSPHKAAQRVGEAAGVTDFRLHDLRRTGASRLEALGVESDVIEAALGHSRPSLARTYRPAFPEAKVRAALGRLAEHYWQALGAAWWEPDEAERERLADVFRLHDIRWSPQPGDEPRD